MNKIIISLTNNAYNINIIQMSNRCATIKPLKNKYIQLKEVLHLFSHEKLKEIIATEIKRM